MSVKLAEAMAQTSYDKSADPESPDNDSQDFQDGFIVGSLYDINEKQTEHPICKEYQRRGYPEDVDGLTRFKDWKRGYWAGIFRHIDDE